MLRKIIEINEDLCNGCGACAEACHEGAIGMVDGKAKLLRDDYCDGLGDCLPACPTGAITFVEREAAAYDEKAVSANMAAKADDTHGAHAQGGGCPGSRAMSFARTQQIDAAQSEVQPADFGVSSKASQLRQWPVQIKLAPINAPYFAGAHLLIAADCAAYAHGDFHNKYLKNRIALIGCPKLDSGDYSEKLTEIIKNNDIKSVTCVRMQVPCCGGIEHAVKTALQNSGKFIPWNVVTLSVEGEELA